MTDALAAGMRLLSAAPARELTQMLLLQFQGLYANNRSVPKYSRFYRMDVKLAVLRCKHCHLHYYNVLARAQYEAAAGALAHTRSRCSCAGW
jgi:hypothetical protein